MVAPRTRVELLHAHSSSNPYPNPHPPGIRARPETPPAPPRCATESVTSPCAAPWAGVRGELCLPSRTGLAGCLRGGGSARTSLARAHAPLSPLLPPSIADRLSRMSTKVVDTTTHPLPSKQTSPLARTVPGSVHVFPQFRINCAAATTPAHIPRTALNTVLQDQPDSSMYQPHAAEATVVRRGGPFSGIPRRMRRIDPRAIVGCDPCVQP